MNRYLLLFCLLLPTLLFSQTMTEILAQLPNKAYIADDILYEGEIEEKRIPIDKAAWDALGLERLETYDDGFKYFASAKQVQDDYTLLIIDRDYDTEAYHWLLLLDKQNKIVDHLVAAYDNAEGFCATKSAIDAGKVTLFEHNIYEIPEEWKAHYTATATGFEKVVSRYKVTAPSGLTIRNQPSTAGTKLMVAPYGSELVLVADTMIPFSVVDNGKTIRGNWMRVILPSKIEGSDYTEGFVFGGYLKQLDR